MIPGILLAAGLSSRFGSQKLLSVLADDTTLFDHSLRLHLNASIDPLVIVVSREIFSALQEKKNGALKYVMRRDNGFDWYHLRTPWGTARLIVNETPETGMADSLKQGLSVLSEIERRDGVLISLADMPRITPGIIERLLAEYQQGEKRAVVPMFEGRIGHPVIFDEPFFREEIQGIKGDEGLRSILKRHWRDVTVISWEDASVVMDVDTPADMEKILRDGA
ncbi:MAG: nucleotidyltransferase family protein [Deltaproteobacteria bacterium]|nr:nucleotidyltransferase family protein [Deltaproteobacteria bacterium]